MFTNSLSLIYKVIQDKLSNDAHNSEGAAASSCILGCTISLTAVVLPGHQLTGPSEEEQDHPVLTDSGLCVYLASYNWHSMQYSVYLASYNWHSIQYSVYLASYNWHSMQYSVYLASYNWHSIQYSVYLASYNWHSTQYSVYLTSYNWHSIHLPITGTPYM
jgi:hypothetical protein